jgi:polyferredoxin
MKQKQKVKNLALIRRKRQEWVRIGVQIVFFLAAPSIYSSAFSGIKNAFAAIGEGQPLAMTGFVMHLFLTLLFTLLFGRYFCGWACAFGSLGDWVFRFSKWVQKKTKLRLPSLPEQAVKVLQWGKYVVLLAVVLLCFFGKSSVVSANSPWTVFSRLSAGKAPSGCGVGIFLMVLILLGMAVQERFFCQFLCPMGAVFSLIPVLPLLDLKREASSCPASCGACKKNCPVSLMLEKNSMRQGECIRCGRCSGICPRENISTVFGLLRGNELWADLIKGGVLLILVLVL